MMIPTMLTNRATTARARVLVATTLPIVLDEGKTISSSISCFKDVATCRASGSVAVERRVHSRYGTSLPIM